MIAPQASSPVEGEKTAADLRGALRDLLSACERYDEDPSNLTIAIYEQAKERARRVLGEVK